MAFHTRVKFAELCCVSRQYINTIISRKQLVLSGDYLDDSIEPNISFIKKCLEKKKGELTQELETVEIVSENNETIIAEIPTISKPAKVSKLPKPNIRNPDMTGHDLKTRKAILDIEDKEMSIALQAEKLNKINGATIPLEQVKQAGQTSFKNCAIAFRNILEKRLTRWSKKFTPEEMAKERSETLRELNQAINNAVDESKKSIAEIISISSNKKEVGERE